MNIPRFSVRNPVCVNLIMLAILVMGVVLYAFQMPKEIFPEFETHRVVVSTAYPGASPREVEKNLTMKVEEAVADMDYLDELASTSTEGRSSVTLKVSPEVPSMAKFVSDVQQAVDQIDSFPVDAENPDVREVSSIIPVITISIFGDVNLLHLRDIVDDLKDEVAVLDGVSDVRMAGLPERELWVEADPAALERYGLTMADVARVLDDRNLDLPGGTLTTTGGEYLIRTVGRVPEARDLADLPLLTTARGGAVRLGDVAAVRNWFERETTLGRFNQRRAVNLTVTKTRSGDAIKVAAEVRRIVASYRERLPDTVDAAVFNDSSRYIRNRLDTLKQSGMQGLVVVFCFLFLMLSTRTAFMVTLGIPISFLGAIIIMSYAGMTMNMIAMFALIVVLGLVVDDAVIIGENIYRHYEKGLPPDEAAILGASEVAWPVASAVATTVAAFMPLLLMSGTMGVFLGVIPKVISFALLVSLFEALVILPSHMAEFLPREVPPPSRFRRRANAALDRLTAAYARWVDAVLEWRYVFLCAAVALSVLIITFTFTHVGFRMFEQFEGTQFWINVEGAPSLALEETGDLTRRIEHVVRRAIPEHEFASLVTNVGMMADDVTRGRTGENLAQLLVELKEIGAGRTRSIKAVVADVRRAVAPFQEEADVFVKEMHGGPGGKAIYILITGDDLDVLATLSAEVKDFIRGFSAVSDVKDNLEAGKPELQVRLRSEAHAMGLTYSAVARQLRNAFYGASASDFQMENEDVDVLVKLPENAMERADALARFKVSLPDGTRIELAEVADVVKTRGVSRIIRDERKRAVTVTGELDQSATTSGELALAVKERFKDLAARMPGYRLVTERGEVRDMRESWEGLTSAFLLGLFLIYFILGAQFKSYVQPLVVMAAIPFGIDGVCLGHILMGRTLGILSMIGLVALSGIVVNDSLVLVDFVNKRRAEGADRRSSLVEAGMIRLRPVLLTSITTMGGLFFLAFLATGQARFLAPMAISIFFGLTLSTVITLFLVPSIYAILDDVSARFQAWRSS